ASAHQIIPTWIRAMSSWNQLAPLWWRSVPMPEDDESVPRVPATTAGANPFSSPPTLDPSGISALLEGLPPTGYFLDPHRWHGGMPDYQPPFPSGLFTPADWADPPAPSGMPSSLPSATSLPPAWLPGASFAGASSQPPQWPDVPASRPRVK